MALYIKKEKENNMEVCAEIYKKDEGIIILRRYTDLGKKTTSSVYETIEIFKTLYRTATQTETDVFDKNIARLSMVDSTWPDLTKDDEQQW